jgi:hypothetical protein
MDHVAFLPHLPAVAAADLLHRHVISQQGRVKATAAVSSDLVRVLRLTLMSLSVQDPGPANGQFPQKEAAAILGHVRQGLPVPAFSTHMRFFEIMGKMRSIADERGPQPSK